MALDNEDSDLSLIAKSMKADRQSREIANEFDLLVICCVQNTII